MHKSFFYRLFVWFLIIQYNHLTIKSCFAATHKVSSAEWQNAGFSLKVKRQEREIQGTGDWQSGVELKLTWRGAIDEDNMEEDSSDHVPQKDNYTKATLFHAFLSDHCILTGNDLTHGGLEPFAPTMGKSGYRWRSPHLPGLNFIISKDGSLNVQGSSIDPLPLSLLSTNRIEVADFTHSSLQLKGKEIRLDRKVSLGEAKIIGKTKITKRADVNLSALSMIEGDLTNNGKIHTKDASHIHLQKSVNFVNKGQLGSHLGYTFSGKGNFNNQGDVQAHTLQGNFQEMINRGKVTAMTIDLSVFITLENHGSFNGKDSLMLSVLAGNIFNDGTMESQNLYKIITQGALHNRNKILGKAGTIKSFSGKIINEGLIEYGSLLAPALVNQSCGKISHSSKITVKEGENLGSLWTEEIEVQEGGLFTNKENMLTRKISGKGSFHNIKKLRLVGDKQVPAIIDSQTFLNQTDENQDEYQADISGSYIKLTSNVKNLFLKRGKVSAGKFLVEGGHRPITYINEGEFIAHILKFQHPRWADYGQWVNKGKMILDYLQGRIRIFTNHKELLVKEKVSLPNTALITEGVSHFGGEAELGKIKTKGRLTALKGLKGYHWDNTGQAEIHKLFAIVQKSRNEGTLKLVEAFFPNSRDMINHGTTSFVRSPDPSITFCNMGDVLLEEGGTLSSLYNHNQANLISGDYTIFHLYNRGAIDLWGSNWTVSTSPQKGSHNLTFNSFDQDETGKLCAEDKLMLKNAPPAGKITAPSITYSQPEANLTPKDLTRFATKHLEVEARGFHVPQTTSIGVPITLNIKKNFSIAEKLITKDLNLKCGGDFLCGNGSIMSGLQVDGNLSMDVASMPRGLYYVWIKGKGWIQSRREFIIGEQKGDPRVSHTNFTYTLHSAKSSLTTCVPFQKILANGTFIATESGDLTLRTLSSILSIFGQTVSGEKLFLEAESPGAEIICEGGSINAADDIYVRGRYIHKRTGLTSYIPEKLKAGKKAFVRNLTGTINFYRGTEALMQSRGNIHFENPAVENMGSTIEAAGSIYHLGEQVAGSNIPFKGTFKNQGLSQTINFSCILPSIALTPIPALVIAGGTVAIKGIDSVTNTGVMQGNIIDILAMSLYAANTSRTRTQPTTKLSIYDQETDSHYIIDLLAFARASHRPGLTEVSEDGRIQPRISSSSSMLNRETLLFLDHPDKTHIPPLLPDLSFFEMMLHPSLLPSVMQRAMSTYLHRQSFQGLNVQQLINLSSKEGRRRHETRTSPYIELHEAPNYPLLTYTVTPNNQLVPKLIAPKEGVNPYTQQGDMSAVEDVTIHTITHQEHYSNTVASGRDVSLTSDGVFTRKTSFYRNNTNHHHVFDYEGPRQQVIAGGSVTTFGGDLNEEHATFTFAKEDVHRGSQHEITINPNILQTHTSKKKGHTRKRKVKNEFVPSKTGAGRDCTFTIKGEKGKTTVQGSEIQAGNNIAFDNGDIAVKSLVEHDIETIKRTKKSLTSKQKSRSFQKTPTFGVQYLSAGNNIHFTESTGEVVLEGVQVQAQKLINESSKDCTIAPQVGLSHHQSKSFQGTKYAHTRIKTNIGQEIMVPSTIDVDQIVVPNAKLQLISAKLLKEKSIEGIYEETVRQLNKWREIKQKTKKVPQAVVAVTAVAVSAVTGGVGAFGLVGMMGAMASASFQALCSTVATTLVATGGDLEATAKAVVSKGALLNLASSVVTAGTMNQLGITAPTGYNTPLSDIMKYSAQKTLISTGVNVALGREKHLGRTLKDAGISFAVDVIGRYGANQIGKHYYGDGEAANTSPTNTLNPAPQRSVADFLQHKLLHGALGGVNGAIRGDALAGAIGGMVSELIVDTLKEDKAVIQARVLEKASEQGITPDRDNPDFQALIEQEVRGTMLLGKIGGIVATSLAKHDVDISLEAATNAVENNFLPAVIMAISAGITAYETWNVYQEEGIEGASESLATDLLMGAATGGAAKLIGKTVKAGWGLLKGTRVIKGADIGLVWGKGIQKQGMPWENYLAQTLPTGSRLPKNFKTFDFYDRKTLTAISAKTLDTMTTSRIANPQRIYQSLKKNIDSAISFEKCILSGRRLTSSIISKRRLEIAIPKATTSEQWKQISRAIEYGKSHGVEINITRVK